MRGSGKDVVRGLSRCSTGKEAVINQTLSMPYSITIHNSMYIHTP